MTYTYARHLKWMNTWIVLLCTLGINRKISREISLEDKKDPKWDLFVPKMSREIKVAGSNPNLETTVW